jgi:hypothetical protein
VTRAEADAVGRAGSIDIVAGRARKLPENENVDPEETAPRLVENTRGVLEVNKTPYLVEGRQDNPREGDPDFENDAARLLVTMQSEADVNFGITDIDFPTDTLEPTQPNEGTDGTLNKSYVLAKADNIRIIARKNDDVNGTVLIIREGSDDTDLAYLYINQDGKLQIFAPEIYLGQATGKEEPYIKWSEYKNSVDKLQEQIDELKTFCNNLTTTLQAAFTAAIAVPYSPISGLTAQIPTLLRNNASLNILETKKEEALQAVENAKSERIWGE